LPQIQVQSPVNTTLAWFKAVNDENAALALAHFAPADREQMRWSQWGPTFTHLRCSLRSETASTAEVSCTYTPAGVSGSTFWSVDLRRESSGRWLITGYGQP
jgi:hypothetical protein